MTLIRTVVVVKNTRGCQRQDNFGGKNYRTLKRREKHMLDEREYGISIGFFPPDECTEAGLYATRDNPIEQIIQKRG